ncbi:MAG: TonB-dependent receptor, partial [Verrucomicrobiota bacterium]
VLKSGIGYNEKQRDIRGRLFKYDFGSTLRRNINNDDQFGVDFLADYDSDEYIDGTNRGGEGLWLDEQTRSGNTIRNLDAFQDINAAYLMGTLSWDNLKITGGFRFEQEERGFNVITELNREEDANRLNEIGPQNNSYILPAISAVYSMGGTEDEPTHFFRVAYGRTIARPTFYEYAPIRTVDQATGLEIRGNGALEDTLIDNFDLRWEWFPAPTDLVSVSFFHKQMDSPIVTTVGTRAGSKFFRSWDNSPSGFIQGIELEYRKQLSGWFQHFLVSTNFTYILSEIEPIEQEGGGTGSASVYEGQPSYIFNLNLGYDNPETGWAANLVYNYTGEILTDVSADDQVPNIFKEGFSQLDFVVSKTFQTENFLNGVKLKLAVKNILDSEVRRFYEGESLTYDSYFNGRSFS